VVSEIMQRGTRIELGLQLERRSSILLCSRGKGGGLKASELKAGRRRRGVGGIGVGCSLTQAWGHNTPGLPTP